MTQSHPQYRADTFEIGPFGSVEVSRQAEFLTCLEATAPFFIAFDDAPKTQFVKGLSFEATVAFNKYRVENPNDAIMSITIGTGRGNIRDARLVLSGAVETSELAANSFESPPPVVVGANSVTQLAVANGTRKEIILKNLSATERLWLKSSGTTGEGGIPIDGGEGVVLTTTAEIFAFNGAGVAVSVAVAEMETTA